MELVGASAKILPATLLLTCRTSVLSASARPHQHFVGRSKLKGASVVFSGVDEPEIILAVKNLNYFVEGH
jgi:hypothetical protein